ncbi:MAG: hypothetical protein R6V30_11120 [Paracoccaceae bacterium]
MTFALLNIYPILRLALFVVMALRLPRQIRRGDALSKVLKRLVLAVFAITATAFVLFILFQILFSQVVEGSLSAMDGDLFAAVWLADALLWVPVLVVNVIWLAMQERRDGGG